jgi:hypothetical protein
MIASGVEALTLSYRGIRILGCRRCYIIEITDNSVKWQLWADTVEKLDNLNGEFLW